MALPPPDGQGSLADGRYALDELLDKIENGTGPFVKDFAEGVKNANKGEPAAIAWIESWFEPAEIELANFGIHRSRRDSLSRCTDKNLFLYRTLAKKAPEVFLEP